MLNARPFHNTSVSIVSQIWRPRTHLPSTGVSTRFIKRSYHGLIQMIGDQVHRLAEVGLLFIPPLLPAVRRIVTVSLIFAVVLHPFPGVIGPGEYWPDFPAQTKRCEDGVDNHVHALERKRDAFCMVAVGACVGVSAIEAQGTAWSWM